MYIKIRKASAKYDEKDLIINVTKISTIFEIHNVIREKWKYSIHVQKLFYKGKPLSHHHRIIDYDIKLNDVLQLHVKLDSNVNLGNNIDGEQITECYNYKVGDLIEVRDRYYGAWFHAVLVAIIKSSYDKYNDHAHSYYIQLECDKEKETFQTCFNDIRLRAEYVYKLSDLCAGQVVKVNYNIEDPTERGYWYDMKITKKITKSTKYVIGTLYVGKDLAEIKNCKIKFIEEIMRIETINDNNGSDICDKSCDICEGKASIKCTQCGCCICGGKQKPEKMIMCDECDKGYHIWCLTPPLNEIPKVDEWFCPDCKTDDTTIITNSDELKISKKKLQMPAYKNDSKGVWGRGMACVGRSKECLVVPKNHFGPIPDIPVGTCWKFRVQVSEAGVHRPHVAGIHGRETDGAYSLILSGGYEDDIDYGDEFLYTGSGGRDLSGNKRMAEQSCDQVLTRMNKALALSCNVKLNEKVGAEADDWRNGKPVRVVRNYKLRKHSKYAPEEGNRYDGIYKVVKYYREKGKSGFYVWRYLLRRDDPVSAPWHKGGQQLSIIYPDGYLEAQESIEQCTKKKRKTRILKEQDLNKLNEKPKLEEFQLDKDTEALIHADVLNEKIWKECAEYMKEGKQAYLNKLSTEFVCVCCQDILQKPVTTKCKHNICLECLKRAFSSEIYSCTWCRTDLGKNYLMQVNTNLSEVLQRLLPNRSK